MVAFLLGMLPTLLMDIQKTNQVNELLHLLVLDEPEVEKHLELSLELDEVIVNLGKECIMPVDDIHIVVTDEVEGLLVLLLHLHNML